MGFLVAFLFFFNCKYLIRVVYLLAALSCACWHVGQQVIVVYEDLFCSPQMCMEKDPCCEPHQCVLKAESQCSDLHHSCCKNCLVR